MIAMQVLIKAYIRQNLVLETRPEFNHSCGDNQVVSLRFVDEDKPFAEATVYIPEVD